MSIVTQTRFLALVFICHWSWWWCAESYPLDLTKSSRLQVNLIVEHDATNSRFRYAFEESYSSEQRRTRIIYSALGYGRDTWFDTEHIPAAGMLIAGEASFLLWSKEDGSDETPKRCLELSRVQFRRLCANQALDEIAPGVLEGENAIRGPSAVLLLVEQSLDKLKRVNMMNPSLRNTPSIMFAYLGDKFQLHCFYSVEQVQQTDGDLGSHLPMRVTLDTPDGLHLEYDFLHYETDVHRGQEADDSAGPYFDEFSIERATGCSAYASAILGEEGKLLPGDQNPGRSLSFTAKVPESFQGEQATCRVAYMDELGVMHVESESSAKTARLLVDFNLGTTHHMLERTEAHEQVVDAALDQVLAPTHLAEGGDATRACILLESPRHKPDFIELLTGAPSGDFLHLGQARVRGVWTRAYEAYNTTWPSWLAPPVAYIKQGAPPARARQVHEPYHDLLEAGVILSTVVYLSQGDETEGPKLVQVEIYRMYHETKRVLSQVSVPVLDFSWSPAQVDLSSLSLANKCLGESDQHGQVELLLTGKRGDTPSPEWLRDNHLRDVALLESIQNHLKIPISMVDLEDFSSRLVEVATVGEEKSAKIEITFGFFSSSKRSVAKLTHCGPGRVKKLYQFKLFRLERSSLQTCFYLAAHHNLDTFFAHSRHDSLCLVDFGPNPLMPRDEEEDEEGFGPARRPQPKAFEMDAGALFEIFFVHHNLESNPSDLLRQLHAGPISRSGISNSQLMRRLQLRNSEDRTRTKPPYTFIIQSLKLLDLNNDQQPFRIDDVNLENTDKFVNFGLAPDGRLASRVGSQLATDVEACRAVCLTSSTCKAYSWCMSGASPECVLSSVGFKPGSDLLLQLIDVQQKRPLAHVPTGYRERQVHSLWINATHFVRVKQQVGCELRNKLYLDLFHKQPERRQNLGEFGSINPVDGRDQCAQRCFKLTLKALGEGENLLTSTKTQLEQLFQRTQRTSNGGDTSTTARAQVDAILTSQRSAAKQMCKEFYYLDAANLQNIDSNVREQYHLSARSEQPLGDDEAQGYCLTMRPPGDKPPAKYNRDATIDALERYSFKFELLYEKKKSVRLLPSKRSPEELDAYRILMSRQMPSNIYDLEPLWGLVNERKNSQNNMMMSHMDESTCASICATQITGPWPACKSFDLVVMSSGRGDSDPSAVCIMNSITLQDAIDTNQQQQLIDHSSSPTHVHWHYEPRFVGEVRQAGGERTAATGVPLPGEMFMAQRAMYFGLPSTMIICVCVIGTLTGILMGLNLGLKYTTILRRRSSGLLSENTLDADRDFTLSIDLATAGRSRSTISLSHIAP